jgi:glycosyltransferase involved in cell wall biosynthesis
VTSVRNRTLFIYWGRRGYLSALVLELAKVSDGEALFSVSRQNELFDQIKSSGASLLPVDTFNRSSGAIFSLFRLSRIRRELLAAIETCQVGKVVVLIPHVWTPMIADCVRNTGARYVVVVHDATNHPGDATALVNRWLLRDALKADEVVTLSSYVNSALIARFPQLKGHTSNLFLPVIRSSPVNGYASPRRPVGFLFFGRLLAYKGLPLFIEACELLRARGANFRVGVAGEGNLGGSADRLAALNAVVTNRWIAHDEVATIFGQFDCMVLSNVEASQSGVVALAHGFGIPVAATPVGGLIEQIKDRRSGLIARDVSAAALAEAMELFMSDAELRQQLSEGVAKTQKELSVAHFFQRITERQREKTH